MRHVTIEIIGDSVNASIVRLPERRFPGLVIQGDSLAVLTSTLTRALEALRDADLAEASEELRELAGILGAYRAEYERALDSEGIDLPYADGRIAPGG
ncbi:MAG: hypothetical protein ABI193_12675 [Minicystis sp.]